MSLHPEQIAALGKRINPHRVRTDPKGFAYVEQYDVRAMLSRLFGFAGWSLEQLHEPRLLFEQRREMRSGKPGVAVGYLCSVAIVVHETGARYQGTATGTAVMGEQAIGDAHDSALKTADSGALKRAAINLGDQFGLGLYDDGSTAEVVRKWWDGSSFTTGSTLKTPDPEVGAS